MELQYELMLFTLFICLGAGIFAVQGMLDILGKGKGFQMPALACSFASVAIGGIGAFLHLQHWERIFNGFGHLESGITQELIAVAVFMAAIIAYLVALRRYGGGNVPKWVGAMAMVVSVVLVVVMAHSYNMASRPAWDTPLLWLYYLANATLFGSLAATAIVGVMSRSVIGDPSADRSATTVPGAGVSSAAVMDGASASSASDSATAAASLTVRAVQVSGISSVLVTAAYAGFLMLTAEAFVDVGSYFDPTHPIKTMADAQAVFSSVFTGDHALLFWLGVVIVGLAVPLALSFLMRGNSGAVLAAYSGIGLMCALAGGMCFRALLYVLGLSVFMFY